MDEQNQQQQDRPLPYNRSSEDTPDIGNSPLLKRPVILGDLTLASPTTQTTVGAAGGATAQPATPLGYLLVQIGTTTVAIPYHLAS